MTRYDLQSDYPRLVERLRALCGEGLSSAAIAERLNAEGFRPPKRTNRFTGEMVLRLTSRLGLERRERHGSPAGLGPDEYRPMGLARRLGMSRDTVRRWLRAGWLTARRDAEGHHVIWADASELRTPARTPPAPADLGEQRSAGRIEEAETPPGAVECRWPGSRRAGPPYLALGGHYGWNIEEFFEDCKSYPGMTQYETRSWVGWHHHMTLVGLAHLFVMLARKRLQKEAPELTLDRTVRLLVAAFDEPELKLTRAIALVDYHVRRNEVARKSHTQTWQAKHPDVKLLRL